MSKKYLKNNIIVVVLSIIVGFALFFLNIMLPWMFGPIIASLIAVKIFKLDIKWPTWLSNLGLIMLGVQIGSAFTKPVMHDIKDDFIAIVLVSIFLLCLALIVSLGFKKIAKVNTETAILSVIPGALSQMLVMAEENKRADILVVSLTQTSRIIFVVILVPLISFFFQNQSQHQNDLPQAKVMTDVLELWQVGILIVGVIIVYYIMKWIHFPTKMLLAPIVVLIIWNISTDLTFTLDQPIIAIAQVIYMIRVGVQIAHLTDRLKGRIAVAIAFQNVLLIFSALLMVIILSYFTHDPVNELFLGAAPGGMSQIVLVALETGADVALISSYHIFRVFFILFLVAPLLNIYLKRLLMRE
ncbi:AbrB family transcriptional regulator [Staphylococcus canis]|uniref:AbrB family transcriptional regulator n=1 Tax=Staphylococcus canis TaxID=2724942 RepID=A0ABS0T6K6_9STAP|nr:AbrB family transcriptional regulator [Staphylococcus canis]MBI5974195.1 AbrB family transcriptional regulator [Staphylococcus canis]